MSNIDSDDDGYISAEDADFVPSAETADAADRISKHVVEEPEANILRNVEKFEKEQLKQQHTTSGEENVRGSAHTSDKINEMWEQMRKAEKIPQKSSHRSSSIVATAKQAAGKKRKSISIVRRYI